MAKPLVSWKQATSESNSWSRIPPSSIMARVLAANTAESITVPTGAKVVLFSGNTPFYANCYATAAVPAADITDGTSPELNPVSYILPSDVTSISVIAPAAGIVTASFYAE